MLFFEVNVRRSENERPYDCWCDISDANYFIWESIFGRVQLRKRTEYPQTFAYVQGNTLYCGYGNAVLAQTILAQPLASVDERLFYDDEFLFVAVDCRQQYVALQRDAFGTIPLFAGHIRNQLVLANSYEKICTSLPQGSLCVDSLSLFEYLHTLGQRSNTLFKEITTLYDRVRLQWHKTYKITEAPDAQAVVYAQKHRNADPKLFVSFLEETLERYWCKYVTHVPAACDLSGGYDSSLIAGYYADKQYPLTTGTMMYPGAFGTSVQQKLYAFLERFPIANTSVSMDVSTEFPLVDMAVSGHWHPFYPRSTLYGASIRKVADSYVRHGAHTIFTGIGGDELCQNIDPAAALEQGQLELERRAKLDAPVYAGQAYSHFSNNALEGLRRQRKSVPLLAYSVAQQNISGYETYINHGLWPVAPLADPRLFAYCQSLPIRYRTQKNILRSYLYARKFPSAMYDGARKEHFGVFFDLAVGQNLKESMRMFFASSVLVQNGIIDEKALSRMLHAPSDDTSWIDLYTLLSLEINLQTLGVKTIL